MSRPFGYGLKGATPRPPRRTPLRTVLKVLLVAAVLTGGHRLYKRLAEELVTVGSADSVRNLEPQLWAYDQTPVAGEDAVSPWLTPEEAVGIVFAHHETTPFFDGSCSDYRLVFVDLDFDGVLEILVVTTGGASQSTACTAYRIDGGTRKLVAFPRTGDRTGESDYGWRTNAIRLVRNKATGQKCYSICESSGKSSDSLSCEVSLGHVWLRDRSLHTVDVACIGGFRATKHEPLRHTYRFKGKDVTKDRFCEAMEEFCSGYADLHLKVGVVSRGDVAWLDPQLLRKRFLDAYLAFGYDGRMAAGDPRAPSRD